MDLVIKPTEKCNFKCTFCSSTDISDDDNDILSVYDIKRFLTRYPETNTIIVNGGDPLMMPPSYYEDILKYIADNGLNTTISITSNLWPFYKNPKKWEALFQHPHFNIVTSFQFGEKRLKGDLTPFTLNDFWAVSNKVLEVCGYRPDFIAVIDEDNEITANETVRLAKEMGVDCKLNYKMASGTEVSYRNITQGSNNEHYLLADMYCLYVSIWEEGLAEWEYNTRQMARKLRGELTTCPLSRTCDSGIRTLQPSGRYYSCPALGDDDSHRIDFEEELNGPMKHPLTQDTSLTSMKNACYDCPLFSICNSCRKTISDHQRFGRIEEHCFKMKQLAPRIIEANGMTGRLIPTPYINESSLIARTN